MCDYSLQSYKSRPAEVGDKLISRGFSSGSRGFTDLKDPTVAVCLLPGTEVAFDKPIESKYLAKGSECSTAVFNQREKNQPSVHHDMLELPDGRWVLVTHLAEHQTLTVLQLPAAPRNEAEKEEQRRAAFVG